MPFILGGSEDIFGFLELMAKHKHNSGFFCWQLTVLKIGKWEIT